MRLGFVTTPNTVVFALHFSTGIEIANFAEEIQEERHGR